MEDEIWKWIDGYEGQYQISNYGRVKSFGKKKDGFIRPLSEGVKGYVQITLCLNNKLSPKKIHRLVALAFVPNPKNKPEVNHIDGDKKNNHVSNLEWCTTKENIRHGRMLGLNPIGEDCFASKLTVQNVLEIRNTPYKKGILAEFARKFNVSFTTISGAYHRKYWKYVL